MLFNTKKHFNLFCIVTIFFVVFSITFSSSAYATTGVPSTISYQGHLTDSGGNLLGGAGTPYYFKFSFWDSSTVGAGSKLWPATSPSSVPLTVRQGVFNVDIGDTTAGYPDTLNYDFNTNSKIYLQVEISSDNVTFETLSPRSSITSSAFSQVANQVSGTSPSSFGTTTPITNSLISAITTGINQVAMTIKGIVGQVANLFNITDSSGNPLFTVGANGNTGVGTSTPGAKLDVWGNLNVGTSSIPALFVNTATGNVGVGTSTPTSKLYVDGPAVVTDNFTIKSSGVQGSTVLGVQSNSLYVNGGISSVGRVAFMNGWGVLDGNTSLITFTSAGNAHINISPGGSGNLGINNISPAYNFDIKGKAGSSNPFNVASSTGVSELMVANNGNVGIGTSTPSAKLQSLATTEQLRLGYNASNYTSFTVGSTGDFRLTPSISTANVLIGKDIGQSLTTGTQNIILGNSNTGLSLSTGSNNFLAGSSAGPSVTGSYNSAIGYQSMLGFTSGDNNTGIGTYALYHGSGDGNVGIGSATMFSLVSGNYNVAIGASSLNMTTGDNDVAIGRGAGNVFDSGSQNTFIGFTADVTSAGLNLTNATAIGSGAKVGASNSLILGGTGAYAVNVGIGTTTPAAQLAVQIGSASTIGQMIKGVSSQSADYFQTISSTGAKLTFIDSNGDLFVGRATGGHGSLRTAGGSNDLLQFGAMDSNTTLATFGVGALNTVLGGFFETGADGHLGFYGDNGVEFARFNTTGNLGIGTTTPGSKLVVNGNIDLGTTTSSIGGALTQNGTRLLHSYGTQNFFAGASAGNFTTSGAGQNVGVGVNALMSVTTGELNTAVGFNALSNTSAGNQNTAFGWGAGGGNGGYNSAFGVLALGSGSLTGGNNMGFGIYSLSGNTSGNNNIGIGYAAGQTNTTGNDNTLIGKSSDVASNNLTNATAIGSNAIVGASNSLILGGTGAYAVNVGIGTTTPSETLDVNGNINIPTTSSSVGQLKIGGQAMFHNYGQNNNIFVGGGGNFTLTPGVAIENVSVGGSSLSSLTTGDRNMGFGAYTLTYLTTGSNNVAVGDASMYGGSQTRSLNVGIGSQTLRNASGDYNVAIGYSSGYGQTGQKNIGIGPYTFGNSVTTGNLNLALGYQTGYDLTSGSNNIILGSYVDAASSTADGQLNIGNVLYGTGLYTGTSNSSIPTVGGMIGIGTSTPGSILDVWGNLNIATSSTPTLLANTGTGGIRFGFLTGAGANLIVDANGNVTVASDERLKNIQSTFTRGLADIEKINPIIYKWKSETGYDTVNDYAGFSAQNVQSAIPEAVGTSSSGFLNLADRPILAAVVNAVKEIGSVFVKIENGVAYIKNIVTDSITAKEVHTNKLCVEDVCVDKDQLKALLINAGGTATQQIIPAVAPTSELVLDATSTPIIEPAPIISPAPETISTPVSDPIPAPVTESTTTPVQ